jgi:hypothetical protein
MLIDLYKRNAPKITLQGVFRQTTRVVLVQNLLSNP